MSIWPLPGVRPAMRAPRQDTPLEAWSRALAAVANIDQDPFLTLPILIGNLAETHREAPALISEEGRLSYRELADRTNRYARWALRQGLKTGDVVCLLMSNCVEYLPIWLGMTRIGATVALINSNLRGASLAYAVDLVKPRAVIVGGDFADALDAARPLLAPELRYWVHGCSRVLPQIDHEIRELSGDRLDIAEAAPPSLAQRALLLYTSGTTGLPKAANVSHLRLMQWSYWAGGMMNTRSDDRMYNTLPMYHSIGGILALGGMLVNGGSVVLRRRFSASRFWDDIVAWDCTLFQYIGELCRYLVNSPPQRHETDHRVRLCSGSGLRAEVWTELQRRFRIPRVLEFYAATEGNFSLYNCEGVPGAIGRIPPFLAHRFPMALVKFDIDSGELVRDRDGFCIRCSANQIGEAIGRIHTGSADPGSRFEGYTDDRASEGKILRNVFAAGDAWLRTGDLMRRDAAGYFYFIDRVGDSFRWKGENVSTSEVAETISSCPGIAEAAVYGVTVPGTEGRAGMAAIVVTRDFKLAMLRRHLVERLPDYARPLFLRICPAIETTGTLKQNKQGLVGEGYNPAVIADPLYFDDRDRAAFIELDDALYGRLRSADKHL